MFGGWYAVRYWADCRGLPRGDWLYGLLLALSPVINPWYLLWLLPFAALFPSAWAWTAATTAFIAYVTGLNLDDHSLQAYQQPAWVRPPEFGPILLALVWPVLRRGTAHRVSESIAGRLGH